MENYPVIVGMACRVPGATNPSKLWENIVDKKDVQRQIPRDRFNVEAFYHPSNTHKGTINTRYGYFIDQPIGDFDAEFFGVFGKEAEAMDPQQRMLLEVTYEALENAGISLESIRGSRTSVYCGMYTTSNDYHNLQAKDLEYYPKYAITGTGSSILSNRVSYFYDLHGPSMTIDTGCLSSLVGFHLGIQSLRNDEADMSIVIGSALNFAPNTYQTMSDMGFLSSDGRCRSFDANGSGYVRGDGICAIVIKRSREAALAGDRIRAVIRATGVNHDGKTDGITLPSSDAQEALIRATYAKAGLDPDETQFFEAHGTGTKAGDPREARAIGAVFGTETRQHPLYIGSIKSNIGHLEGTAGLAGIIKATLAIENATIPPNMHFNTPNPEILFDKWKLKVATRPTPWPSADKVPRRASVNSFGYGGANAHVVLEEFRPPRGDRNGVEMSGFNFDNIPNGALSIENRPYLLPLTSHSPDAGIKWGKALLDYFQTHSSVTLRDLSFSLCHRRSMHQFRCFAVGDNREAVADQLLRTQSANAWKSANKTEHVRVGFLFTGQGAQSFDMGRQLINESLRFRLTLERCDAVLHGLPDGPEWSIVDELMRSKEDSQVSQSRYSQPLCTALQVAMIDLLREWGIKPRAVCGHSSGEIAAAYAAGILTLEAAIVTAYYRGLHMSAGTGPNSIPGSMMAVGLSKSQVQAVLDDYHGRVVVGATNSPSSVTVSGDSDSILELQGYFTDREVFTRLLMVEQAFHSHHMLPLAPAYKQALERCQFFQTQEPTCRMFSSVTGRPVEAGQMDASYWADNMVRPVRYYEALVGTVLDEDESQLVDVLVEIGPHPTLKAPSKEVLKLLKMDVAYIGSLTRDRPAFESILDCVGQLFTHGYPVDLEAVNGNHPKGQWLRDLPSYQWNHKNYWSLTRLVKDHLDRPSRHTLLGAPVPGSIRSMPRWRNYIRLEEIPWLRDHCVDGKVIFPAAGYCCMAIEAMVRLRPEAGGISTIQLKDVMIKAALALQDDDDQGAETGLEIRPVTDSSRTLSDEWYEFIVFSYDETAQETEHCHGFISVEYGSPKTLQPLEHVSSVEELYARSDRYMTGAGLYSRLENINLHYGEYFALLKRDIACGPGYAVTSFEFDPSVLPPNELAEKTILHPTLLDATFHVIFAAIETLLEQQITNAFVSTYMAHLTISGRLVEQAGNPHVRQYTVQTHSQLPNQRTAINHILLRDAESGEVVLEAEGNEVTSLGSDNVSAARRTLFFRQRWQPRFDALERSTAPLKSYDLGDLLRLYVHQHSASRILFVPSKLEDVTKISEHLMIRATGRALCKALHILADVSLEEDAVKNLHEELAGLGGVCEPEGVYDLIILDKNAASAPRLELAKFMDESVVLIANDSAPPDSSWVEQFPSSPRWAIFRQEQASISKANVMVVLPTSPSEFTKAVLADIEALVPQVETVVLAKLGQEKFSGKSIIVLASLDENLESSDLWLGARTILTEENNTVVWVVREATMEAPNPEHAQVLGFLRTARNENKESRYISLDIERTTPAALVASRSVHALARGSDIEEDFADRRGCLYIPRIEEDLSRNRKLPDGICNEPRIQRFGDSPQLSLRVGKVGLLETLHFVPEDVPVLGDDEVAIKVKASALNFHDVAVAMGIIQDYHLGNECAWVITRVGSNVDSDELKVGDRVIAWRPGQGSHATLVHQPASMCVKIPDSMSYSVAASMSIVLTTAYYSLYEVAQLRPGETILIHSAAGGVGQVAIQLAQRVGARVLVTCSESKRQLVRTRFGIKDSEIFSSRDDSFLRGVMKVTNGRGVDVALNSLAGRLLHATWACIAPFGRFVEIGKRDIHQNSNLGMDPFRNNVTFSSVDLILIYELNPVYGEKLLRDSLGLLFTGEVQPPEGLHEYSYGEIDKAFRLMQLGKHTGKVVLILDEDDKVLVGPSAYHYKQLFKPNKTYLLVGGLGGLGTTAAEWMYGRGARSFAFMSRSGGDNPLAKKTIDWLKAKKASVTVYKGDVGVLADVKKVVDDIGSQLAGVFHIAVTKVVGAWNLHEATLSTRLDFFVCWSSVSAICGNKGQGAYVAASAHMDAFMRWRREQGLVGTAMNLGAVPTRGLVAENAQIRHSLERNKLDVLTEQELMFLIEEAVTLDRPTSDPAELDWHQLIVGVNVKQPDVWWAERSVFRTLYANRSYGNAAAIGGGRKNLSLLLAAADSMESKIEVYLQAFVEKVAAVLGTPIDTILPMNPLSAYGLDSIVAVEFRRWIKETAEVDLSLFDVLGSKSIQGLVGKVLSLMPQTASKHTGKTESEGGGESSKEAHHTSTNGVQVVSHIPTAASSGPVPMSTFQTLMYQLNEWTDEKWRLNLTCKFKIEGQPSVDALVQALEEVGRRQDVLSHAYLDEEKRLVQKPLGSSKVSLELLDISCNPDRLREFVDKGRRRTLDMKSGEVTSITLATASDKESYIVLIAHHICFDRGSLVIFMDNWMKLYDAIVSKRDLETIPSPTTRYTEFTLWHNARLQLDEAARHREFWREKLAGIPATSKLLPFVKQDRPAILKQHRGLIERQLANRPFSRLRRICAQANVTPFHFLLAAIRAFLFRWTGEENVVLLTVNGNRPHIDVEDVVGCFVNLMPIRLREDFSDVILEDLVSQAASITMEALPHSDIAFQDIVDLVNHERRPGYMPIGQIAVNYQMYGSPATYRTADFSVSTEELINIPNPCELSFEMVEGADGELNVMIEFSTELYGSKDMTQFSDGFLTFLESCVRDHRQPIQEIAMMPFLSHLSMWTRDDSCHGNDHVHSHVIQMCG